MARLASALALLVLGVGLAASVSGATRTGGKSQEAAVRILDASQFYHNGSMPASKPEKVNGCKLAVVGAGYGGVYFAYRLVFEAGMLSPSDVCVFEANVNRIGGKALTVRNLLGDPDLVVDVGAYRFPDKHKLLSTLIRNRLGLSWRCYFSVTCSDGRNLVTEKDGLDTAGFATPIETMLQELVDGGARIFYGYRLTGLFKAGTAKSVMLDFKNGGSAVVDQVMLGIPSDAISSLNPDSLIFTNHSKEAQGGYMTPQTAEGVKVYLEYADAWWITKLGKFEGFFKDDVSPSLLGRYHDGAVRCFNNKGEQIPLTSESEIERCNGVLLAAYIWQYFLSFDPFYRNFHDVDEPFKIIAWDESDPGYEMITQLHDKVMEVHAEELAKQGYDVSDIEPPLYLYKAVWDPKNDVTGSIHLWPRFLTGTTMEETMKALLRPVEGYDIFMANEAFGPVPGYAEGSIVMAERVLAHELGVERPSWLNDDEYYEKKVLNLSYYDLELGYRPRDAPQ